MWFPLKHNCFSSIAIPHCRKRHPPPLAACTDHPPSWSFITMWVHMCTQSVSGFIYDWYKAMSWCYYKKGRVLELVSWFGIKNEISTIPDGTAIDKMQHACLGAIDFYLHPEHLDFCHDCQATESRNNCGKRHHTKFVAQRCYCFAQCGLTWLLHDLIQFYLFNFNRNFLRFFCVFFDKIII